MSNFLSLAALVVGGLIVADIILHPAGTQAASNGLASILTPAEQGLVGQNIQG